ncbi:MAG: hypothetical protein JRJ19_13590 [Deltaproteobacteria bacterium]|nr:hypothetical protein [Deltaproteobacteria bacterium]
MSWTLRVGSIDGEAWSALLQRQPHLLFHEPLWARIVGAGLGGKALCLLLEHDGQVIGGASGFFLRVLWARFLYLGFPYGGFLGSTPPGGLLAKLLVDFARKENVTRVRITDGPGMPSTPPDGF